MDIFFKCIHCGQRLVVDDAGIGMEIPCPLCAKLVAIPPQSTVPPEETEVRVPPATKLPETGLPPPIVTVASRPLTEAHTPPEPVPAKPASSEETPVPANLCVPHAPARVRRPPGSPPPPRAPKPAPALTPALVEMFAPVPSNLRAPGAPRRVRLPLATPPAPRALQSAPALRPEVVVLLKPAETPPPVPLPAPVFIPGPAKPPPAPASAPPPTKLPPPPPAPKLPETAQPSPPVPLVTVAPPSAPALQGIVPPLDLAFPKVELPPAPPPTKLPPPPPAPVKAEPVAVSSPMPVSVAPSPAAVRLANLGGPAKAAAEQWHGLAAALAQQLWNGHSPVPLRATVVEAFLHAMPRFNSVPGGEAGAAGTSGGRSRWSDPFAGDQPDIVGRFDRPDFEGIAARVAELIERWMQRQENLARQPGSDADDIHFAMMPVPHSAVVSFGMNYRQRGAAGRKRITCWVARVGENRFLFSGKVPPSVSVTLPGFVQSFRAEAGEPSEPLPLEEILNMPPPPNVDAENALVVRRLMLSFCEAYFVRFDNRLAAEFYDQIRRRRDIVRAVIPGMLQVMPPSREKRMLQQLSREL